jgi:hypothetical protein
MPENRDWMCIQVIHHKRIANVIKDKQEKGWRLHTYQVASENGNVNHYLLFEKSRSGND